MLSVARFEVHKIHPILLDSDILNSIHFYAYNCYQIHTRLVCVTKTKVHQSKPLIPS